MPPPARDPPLALKALKAFAREREAGVPTALGAEPGPAGGEPPKAVELELRFPRTRAELFVGLVRTLAEKGERPIGPAKTSFNTHETRSERLGLRTAVVQERTFVGGKRVATAYREKTQISPPYHSFRYGTRLYTLAVSTETSLNEEDGAIVSEANLVHRGKARLSYRQSVPAAAGGGAHTWQIDLTIVRESASLDLAKEAFRELAGYKVDSAEAFARLAEALNQDVVGSRTHDGRKEANDEGAKAAVRIGLARRVRLHFEVEAEYVSGPELAFSDVNLVAGGILRLLDPGFMADASYQEQLKAVDQILRGRDSAASRGGPPSSAPLRLKTVLPQVKALDRRLYADLYPKVIAGGFYITPKADYDRAIAILYADRVAVLGPSLYVFPTKAAMEGEPAEEIRAVLDGEFTVKGRSGAAEFWAFDAMHRVPALAESGPRARAGGRPPDSVQSLPFEGRLRVMEELVPHYLSLPLLTPLTVAVKTFVRLRGAPKELGDSEGRPPAPAEIDASGDVSALRAQLKVFLETKWPFATDGIILVGAGASYARTLSYKLKPPDQKTIDVLARRPDMRDPDVAALVARVLDGAGGRAPTGGAGTKRAGDKKPRREVYFLFSGMDTGLRQELGIPLCPGYEKLFRNLSGRRGYAPVPLTPVADPYAYVWVAPDGSEGLDGKVLELVVRGMGSAPGEAAGPKGVQTRLILELVRVRDDRAKDVASGGYFGNDYRVATQVVMEALHPLLFDELATGPAGDYFAQEKLSVYRRATAFTSKIKSLRIATLAGDDWVVDFAAGKGQDLGRYAEAKVQNLVAIDVDRAALAELAGRYVERARRKDSRSTSSMRVYTVQADLGAVTPASLRAALVRLNVGGGTGMADGGVCNLAAHYFGATGKTIASFARLCEVACRPGGVLILTVMRGEAVHALLKEEGVDEPSGVRAWTATEGDLTKYRIEKRYPGDALREAGQKIAVLLPFSRGEMYEEYLLNEDAYIAALDAAGFDLKERKSFEKHLDQQADDARKLSDVDRAYLALYGELVFEKRVE